MLKLTLLALLFPTLLIATDVQWPTHFDGLRTQASRSRIYGCLGNEDLHYLNLDFVNKTYTEKHIICRVADMHYSGRKGILQLVDNKALKIVTEVADETVFEDQLVWHPIDVPGRDGHFIYVSEQHFDEYDRQGNLFIRW